MIYVYSILYFDQYYFIIFSINIHIELFLYNVKENYGG